MGGRGVWISGKCVLKVDFKFNLTL